MNVAVVGAGYVGLVTAACLADKGHEVVCVDRDEERVSAVEAGRAPIHEPGLPELLARHAGRSLRATTALAEAVGRSDLTMIAVGTPLDGDVIDLGAVREAAAEIGRALARPQGYRVVVVKSTVVPGTTDGLVVPVLEEESGRRAGPDFGVGVNPEFLTEGQAVQDFMAPDRLVLGAIDERSLDVLEQLYQGFDGVPRVRTGTRDAEMVKYASNALLATLISFANEIADVCSAQGGMDAAAVMRGVHLSRYLTPLAPDGTPVRAPIASFLEAGCGFGGSCLPKDVKALAAHGEAAGVRMRLLAAVSEVNEGRADALLARLRRHLPALAGRRVTVLGLAFKPDTDDVRESPAIPVVERLLAGGAAVTVHDPVALGAVGRLFGGRVAAEPGLEEAVRDADAVLLVTRWAEYERLPELLARADPQPVLVDGRRMLDPASVATYDGIGL